ncbi:hypothetical protein PENARI_c026G06958 [Penicillium arizonense]|uniref:C2H2-type domain-containing protein n=1 Tax=Penicillium arizonense TaxID=1835702 RepID=A0A1F5L6D6_PENAI|nr:hypothetical protein PENARI_c026G06958 [Penicillium arizonense]OGE48798.1 hypothetical protein PENARI_c026G06958 [Penicillium arizonense]
MAHPDEREITSYEQSMPDEDLDYDQSPIISNEREFPSAEEQDTDHDAEPIRFHCISKPTAKSGSDSTVNFQTVDSLMAPNLLCLSMSRQSTIQSRYDSTVNFLIVDGLMYRGVLFSSISKPTAKSGSDSTVNFQTVDGLTTPNLLCLSMSRQLTIQSRYDSTVNFLIVDGLSYRSLLSLYISKPTVQSRYDSTVNFLIVDEAIRFHCEFPNCERSYIQKSSLAKHLKTHNPEAIRFHCEFPDCERSYTQKSDLTKHLKIHNPERIRFHCEFPNCERSYTQKSHLARHLKTHDEERGDFPVLEENSRIPIDPTLLGVDKNLKTFLMTPGILADSSPLLGPLTLFVARASSGNHSQTTQRLERSLAELEAKWISHHGPIQGSSRYLTMITSSNAIPTQRTLYIQSIKAALSLLTVKGVTIVFTGHDGLFTSQEGNREFLRHFNATTDLEIFYLEKESNEFHQLCPKVMKGSSNWDSPYSDLTTEWVERANQIGQIKRDLAVTTQALSDAAGRRNKSKKRKRQ